MLAGFSADEESAIRRWLVSLAGEEEGEGETR